MSNVLIKQGVDEPKHGMFLTKDIHFNHKDTPMVIRVSTYMVMFGWRIRASIFSDGDEPMVFDIDLCAGGVPSFISMIYNIVLGRLIRYAEELANGGKLVDMSTLFPSFKNKPIWKNDNFDKFVAKYHKFIPEKTTLIMDYHVREWAIKVAMTRAKMEG